MLMTLATSLIDELEDRALITGITRESWVSSSIGSEPGRVDSPPISIISAPSLNMTCARFNADDKLSYLPPSEKLSGVTFSIPIIKGGPDEIISERCDTELTCWQKKTPLFLTGFEVQRIVY